VRLASSFEKGETVAETAQYVRDLEHAGLDLLWVPESYGWEAFSQIAYLAATTSRIQFGTGIVNVFSRSPGLMAMSSATCDYLTGGRFQLGLGASGPQVIEGFHGVAYEHPMDRIKDYIACCRLVWDRKPLQYEGRAVTVPLPAEEGLGLGKPLRIFEKPVRAGIPIWWASIKGQSVSATAELADGWLTAMFIPEKAQLVWGGPLRAGLARRNDCLAPLEVSATGRLAIGEDMVGQKKEAVLDQLRPFMALYVGGMGAKGKNFYNDLCRDYGYADEAKAIQDLFLSGKKDEAAASVPTEWLELSNLVGPRGYVAERVAAYREAGVTVLAADPVGPDRLRQIETLRELLDGA
jgi:F420-dependent oxidoreductase-like protein